MALQDFERSRVIDSTSADFYLLDLLNYRNISDEISKRLNIIHQSPQVIMLSNNEVLYSETHERINGAKVQHILDEIK
jgi:bacillithiol system protein YtxJ